MKRKKGRKEKGREIGREGKEGKREEETCLNDISYCCIASLNLFTFSKHFPSS